GITECLPRFDLPQGGNGANLVEELPQCTIPRGLESPEWRLHCEAIHISIDYHRVLHAVVWTYDQRRGQHLRRLALGALFIRLRCHRPCCPEPQEHHSNEYVHEAAGSRQGSIIPPHQCTTP